MFVPWPEHGRVALDIETKDLDLLRLGPGVRRGGKIVGIAYAIEDGPEAYLPIDHEGGGNLDRSQVLSYLRDQALRFKGTLVGANLSYDLDYLAHVGVVFRSAEWFRDITIADPLIYELHFRYSLEAIAERYKLPGKDEQKLEEDVRKIARVRKPADVKLNLWKLPASSVQTYAIQDVRAPLEILRHQEKLIEKHDLQKVWDLESRLLPVTIRMTRRGVRIDQRKLEEIEQWAMKNEREALEGTGLALEDLSKARAIGKAFADEGIQLPLTPTGEPCVKGEVLQRIDHPLAAGIRRAKKFNKLRGTFCRQMWEHMVDGRIHATFKQVKGEQMGRGGGAVSGRLSGANPNLMNQPSPKKDSEVAGEWRKIFLPDEEGLWCASDFASQEPRLMVHYALLAGCRGAKAMAERYWADPRTDLHAETAALMGCSRKTAKTIFLGLAYGMGGGKLCKSLGLPAVRRDGRLYAGPEGARLLKRYHQAAPFLRDLDKMCQHRASTRGFIRAADGRQLHFYKIGNSYMYAYRALNRLIQGSAAGQLKMAMLDADRAGHYLQLCVHDELGLTVKDEREARDVGGIMVKAMKLEIPVEVDISLGPSWGEAQDIGPENAGAQRELPGD